MSVLVSASLSASDALTAVLVRTFAMLRVLGVVTTALYLALWWSWYSRHPVGLAAVLLVLVWGLGYVALSLRGRLGTGLVLANVGVGAAGALVAGAAVPPCRRCPSVARAPGSTSAAPMPPWSRAR